MIKIPLTQNKFALVDDEDFDKVNQYKWCFSRHTKKNFGYAGRKVQISWDGKKQISKHILMHRVIMNAPKGLDIDHINHNTLDNRKSNLRVCTRSQNFQNAELRSDNTSGYKGVTFDKRRQKWVGRIGVYGKRIIKHGFVSSGEAAQWYNEQAKLYFKEFARFNTL